MLDSWRARRLKNDKSIDPCKRFIQEFKKSEEFSTVRTYFSKEKGNGPFIVRRGSVNLSAHFFVLFGSNVLSAFLTYLLSNNESTAILVGILVPFVIISISLLINRVVFHACLTCGKIHCHCEEIFRLSDVKDLAWKELESNKNE